MIINQYLFASIHPLTEEKDVTCCNIDVCVYFAKTAAAINKLAYATVRTMYAYGLRVVVLFRTSISSISLNFQSADRSRSKERVNGIEAIN